MKKTILIISSVAVSLIFYSCSDTSKNMDLNKDIKLVQEEIATDREALANEMAEESININTKALFDKWWIADEIHGGADQFFSKDGVYDNDFGKKGKWEWIEEGKSITIFDNGQEVIYDIIELNENIFRFKMKNFVYTYYPKTK